MLCVFPVFKNDVPKLLDLIQWIGQLGGCHDHRAVVVADGGVPPPLVLECLGECRKWFSSCQTISTAQTVYGWPRGPNTLFLAAAWHAYRIKTPWLFLEPDAIPLSPGWLDKIEIAYRVSGCRYMGKVVPCKERGLPQKHFTGVGVYPADAILELQSTVEANLDIAFDLATANLLAPIALDSDLFQHLWGQTDDPPRFSDQPMPGTSLMSIRHLSSKAVIFHRNKDGSLINLLRKKIGAIQPAANLPFIQLGRYGDIILLLPAMKYIHDTTGQRPKLICSTQYASVLDGVSYVEAIPLQVDWWTGMTAAQEFSKSNYGGSITLQCHSGTNWNVDRKNWDSYMTSMLHRTGVPLFLLEQLPLVFDQRNAEREKKLIPNTGGKPIIVINTAGNSSPFPFAGQLMDMMSGFRSRAEIVDIGPIRCERIYDLLGLMDAAVGSVHIDTATLHLAHACARPYVALTVDGWCSSKPLGNCVLDVKYSQTIGKLDAIRKTIASWI